MLLAKKSDLENASGSVVTDASGGDDILAKTDNTRPEPINEPPEPIKPVAKKMFMEVDEQNEDASPTNWLNNAFTEAVRLNASDIHIIPQKDYVSVRFRIDGVIQEVAQWDVNYHDMILSRIKILSGLQVVERNIPQDGRLELIFEVAKTEGKEGGKSMSVNFRVSTMPTINGEVAVLRALNKEGQLLKIDQVGLSQKAFPVMLRMMQREHGVILMTGHSGSGKTSTLYSVLSAIDVKGRIAVTLEDPVEYRLDGVQQSQVNPTVGYDFNVGLKAILRQDPDVIMIGEIRDDETAETALRLALAGRLVLSTLHANDITGAVTRMVDMKIPKSVMASAFTGILSERLVRKICPSCKAEAELPRDLMKMFHVEWPEEYKTYKGKGCDQCSNTGFQGRTGIFEIFEIDDDFRNMVVQGETVTKLNEYVKTHIVESMIEDGSEKVRQGITTLEEVIRAVI